MEKSVILLQALLAAAFEDAQLAMDESPGVALLDFRKAYDTLDRDLLLLALQCFGFSDDFVALILRLHSGATARFLVNKEISQPREMMSGIR